MKNLQSFEQFINEKRQNVDIVKLGKDISSSAIDAGINFDQYVYDFSDLLIKKGVLAEIELGNRGTLNHVKKFSENLQKLGYETSMSGKKITVHT